MGLPYEKAEFERSVGRLDQLEEEDIMEIVFAGRSNVGKSSLLNKLLNRKALAKVSSMPGKTATINFYQITPDVRLVDLPGYGYAKVSHAERKRWDELINGYFSLNREIVLVVLLLDVRHAPSADDKKMLNFLAKGGYPTLIVFTKCDKLSKTKLEEQKAFFDEHIFAEYDIAHIYTSSSSGQGIDELRNILNEVTIVEEETLEEP